MATAIPLSLGRGVVLFGILIGLGLFKIEQRMSQHVTEREILQAWWWPPLVVYVLYRLLLNAVFAGK